MLPPTEKSDMPLAAPPAHVARELRPLRVVGGDARAGRQHAEHDQGVVGAIEANAMPMPAKATPAGRSQSAPRASDQNPNAGWMIDELMVAAGAAPHHRVREVEPRRKEGQERRQRSLGEIRGQMARGKGSHAFRVDACAHRPKRYPGR